MPSGEIRNPARTVPRAVYAGLGVHDSCSISRSRRSRRSLLGPSLPDFATAPLAEAAGRLLGQTGRTMVLAGAIVSMFGYVSGDMLSSPRALFALGRDGILPRSFAVVHPRFHTPQLAIGVYAILVALVAISSSFTQLAILANVTALTLYLMCIAAAWELQRRDVRMDGAAPFVLPAGPTRPVAGGDRGVVAACAGERARISRAGSRARGRERVLLHPQEGRTLLKLETRYL